MAYEIPSKLEYREKIIFGLDFKQLGYAVAFGLIDFVIFFKLGGSIYLRGALMVTPTLLAMGFMFFDIDKRLVNVYHWFRFRGTTDIRGFVGVKNIDKYIHTKKKIAVIEVTPINFNIKTKEEKDTITRQFLKFLNAIDFPIQILMQTKEIDIDSYLGKLSAPEKYKELFKESQTFLRGLIEKNKVQDRVLYLAIPEKDNLDIQVQICNDWLRSINLKTKVLNKTELRELMNRTVQGRRLTNAPSYLQLDKKFTRTIYAHGYPRVVEQGFLDKIVTSQGDFDFSIHINPHDAETMMININKQLQKQKADLYSMGLKGVINPALEIQYNDTRRVLEQLQKGNDKLLDVALYINCKANSEEELNLITKKVQSTLNSLLIIPRVAMFQMDRGYKSLLPLGEDKLKLTRNVTSQGLSAFFPFTSPFFETDDKGVWMGLNKNGIPIIKDIFQLSNPNGVILAQSGGGKSFFAKLLISRYLLNGTKVMIIDPQGEYRHLVEKFGGQRVDLSRMSETIINPLDLMGHDYTEKRLSLMDLMQVMLGDLTEVQKAFIDQALTKTYKKKGINIKKHTWNRKPPILKDLLSTLKTMARTAPTREKSTLYALINRMSIYVDGVFSFLNRKTKINFDNQFVCFDISDIPRPVKPIIMFLVLDYVYMKMKTDIDRKILLIDEAWSLLSRTKDAAYIFEIVKTCRKFNMGLLLINQEVEGLLTSDAGKSVLANSAYTVLLKQKPAVINNITRVFHLSKFEKDYLLSASVGEGILIIENEHFELKVVASEEEHKIITTNADELLEYKEEKPEVKEQQDVNIKVNPEFPFYVYKKVNKTDREFLLDEGFKVMTYTAIDGKKRKYLIRPRNNESKQHCVMTYDIHQYLKKRADNVQLFETKKPDIVFEVKGFEYAIEVETGKIKDKTYTEEKAKVLNEEYGENWFFVVTNRNNLSKYKKYGKVFEKRNLVKKLKDLSLANSKDRRREKQ